MNKRILRLFEFKEFMSSANKFSVNRGDKDISYGGLAQYIIRVQSIGSEPIYTNFSERRLSDFRGMKAFG
jgi:hypothetical protein